jgi:hypothetical protein
LTSDNAPDLRQIIADIDRKLSKANIEKIRADLRAENRRFVVLAIAAAATLLAAGAALATLLLHSTGKFEF